MKHSLLSLLLLVSMLGLSSCASEIQKEESCEMKCESFENICGSSFSVENCKSSCSTCGFKFSDLPLSEENCDEVSANVSQCVFPEKEALNCGDACQNYNNQCITLVPNADQKLFDEGFSSCMLECESWSKEKIECMENANDCPSMTEVCGL